MKTSVKLALVLLVPVMTVMASACYVLLMPVRSGYLRVSASSLGRRTNEFEQIVHAFSVSNRGPFVVLANAGTETKIAERQIRYDVGFPITIEPGAQAVVTLTSHAPESRMMVWCEKVYERDWTGRAACWADAFVLKREVVKRIYFEESPKEPR